MKDQPLFPPELRTAAFVPRWSIVWRVKEDTVSSHSYFVTVYAYMIAKVIGWRGPTSYLMLAALLHDSDEIVTGDVVGPVKSEIVDRDNLEAYVDPRLEDRLGSIMGALVDEELAIPDTQASLVADVAKIVKCADRLDALFYLLVESRLGNVAILPLLKSARANVEAAWRDLPAAEVLLSSVWATQVTPAIRAHTMIGGCGV